jgi:hypothetical protein
MDANRVRLVELVDKLMTRGYATEAEDDAALAEFEAGVPHPRASDLIFYPANEFDHEPTAAEVVDRALSYRAIEL